MPPSDESASGVELSPARSLLRPAIILLLRQRESHGYELGSRLAEIGIQLPNLTGLYRTLRVMQSENLVASYWGTPSRGPARRIYALTPQGEARLPDVVHELTNHWRIIGALLDLAPEAGAGPRTGR